MVLVGRDDIFTLLMSCLLLVLRFIFHIPCMGLVTLLLLLLLQIERCTCTDCIYTLIWLAMLVSAPSNYSLCLRSCHSRT